MDSVLPPPSRPVTVLVTDDDLVFRQLLAAFLEDDDAIEVTGQAIDGADALRQYRALRPDLVLMDIHMPVKDGIDATRALLDHDPDACVLALTVMADVETVAAMLRAGARGYLLKDTTPASLREHIHTVVNGGGALSPAVARALVQSIKHSTDRHDQRRPPLSAAERPTAAEMDVLNHLARGLSNADIGSALFIAEGTVRARLQSLSQRWGIRGRVPLLVRACELGLVRLPSDQGW
ncbi:MAG: response regulator transcription factor [Propionibacteriaceae bacterium]|nr:response regulator transcription factor [Propionibacteriaceae bacterium]